VAGKPFKNIDQALDWLFSATNYEQKKVIRYNTRAFNLERARAILEILGDPHLAYPTVHVAGTKGKGSTCAMTAAIFAESGFGKVGLYTSPHLMTLNERISINFSALGDRDLLECINRVKGPVETVTSRGAHLKPTFFEIFTVIGFLHFALSEVDVAVIEVGLGGRLDATNLVSPVAAAITPVSYDHTAVLGRTLPLIAREKAGIIKPGVPVAVGRQEAESFEAIETTAVRVGAPLRAYGRDYFLWELPAGRFDVQTTRRRYRNLEVPLLGPHQRRNAATAVAVSEDALDALGRKLSEKAVRTALSGLQWAGRVELFSREPPIVIDAAHNAASARALAEAVAEAFPNRKATVLVGIAAHKDTRGVIDALVPIARRFVTTTIDSPRSEDARALAERIRSKCDLPVKAEPDRPKALNLARRLAGEGLLVITGSFYLAGELRGILERERASKT